MKTIYLVLWWMSQMPYVAVIENRVAAEAACNVRNAIMVKITGNRVKIAEVLDWWRRNDAGEPLPAEWRDLVGGVVGWGPRRPHA